MLEHQLLFPRIKSDILWGNSSTNTKDANSDTINHGGTGELFKCFDICKAFYVAWLQTNASPVTASNGATNQTSFSCLFNNSKIDQKIRLSEVPMQDAKDIEAATFAERHC